MGLEPLARVRSIANMAHDVADLADAADQFVIRHSSAAQRDVDAEQSFDASLDSVHDAAMTVLGRIDALEEPGVRELTMQSRISFMLGDFADAAAPMRDLGSRYDVY